MKRWPPLASILAALSLLVGLFHLTRPRQLDPVAQGDAVPIPASPVDVPLRQAATDCQSRGSPGVQPPPAQPAVERPSLPRRSYGPLGKELEALYADDKFLAQFAQFRQRVLLDDEGRNEYRKFLSDFKLFTRVRHDLLFPDELTPSRPGELRRLMAIDYLREALDWNEHPSRANLLSLLEEIILTDNFHADLEMTMRQSIAADKMELFELLHQQDLARAERVLDGARGTRMEALLKYFSDKVAH